MDIPTLGYLCKLGRKTCTYVKADKGVSAQFRIIFYWRRESFHFVETDTKKDVEEKQFIWKITTCMPKQLAFFAS